MDYTSFSESTFFLAWCLFICCLDCITRLCDCQQKLLIATM
nr:MAG TPA: hypothetical protein [Bacteriophage sp.]